MQLLPLESDAANVCLPPVELQDPRAAAAAYQCLKEFSAVSEAPPPPPLKKHTATLTAEEVHQALKPSYCHVTIASLGLSVA